jgi:hypothetical protein
MPCSTKPRPCLSELSNTATMFCLMSGWSRPARGRTCFRNR